MSDQPALFAEPKWTDKWTVDQQVTDGRRIGTVTRIFDDLPGGLAGLGLQVKYEDRYGHHTVNYGYDHMLSDATEVEA